MTNERAIQILENLISINGDIIIGDEGREALEMAIRSLQQEQQEQPDKSLEEAAEIIAKNILGRDYLAELDEDCAIDALEDAKNFVKAGAEWQKQQMLKDAVEGEVYKFGEVSYVKECNNAELTEYLSQFNNGDKVRIVVLKEEEQI